VVLAYRISRSKKCLLVTTHNNLTDARAWIDANLEPLIRHSLPDGTDPPLSLLPRRLDKPVYSAASTTYAEILKKRISLDTTPTTPVTANNRPPRKRQATLIDYDSDDSAASTAINAVPNTPSPPSAASSPGAPAPPLEFASELLSLKAEILSLRNIITEVVAQFKSAIASVPTQSIAPLPATQASTAIEMEVDHPAATKLAIADLLVDIKNDIATKMDISHLIVELRSDIALIKSHPLFCHLSPINQLPVN